MKFNLNSSLREKIRNSFIAGFVVIFFAGFFPGKEDIYFEISKNIDVFSKVYKEISFNYVDDIDPEQFMRAGIKGMLGSLDPYTIFIDENKKDEIELITNGKYGGIGISIGIRGDDVTVVEVLDGYSAQRQGIRIGDILLEAGGKKLTPENIDEVSSIVKGDAGTTIDIKVLRNEGKDTVNFNLVREEVIIKNVTFAGFYPEESNNAYIKLTSFSRSAAEEIKTSLRKLKSEKEIKSIVLDLRGNPGGLLDVAVDICDKFLQKNQLIVSTKGRDEESEKKYYSVQEPMFNDGKLVVLVNNGSASASEIVAGAIQDHDRGVIIGTKTFGKGLVQTITPLSYNTSLKITTAKYYTPSGRCIQSVDYSKDNKVIADFDSINTASYMTDNKRVVYGGGGITPDSTVKENIEGDITIELLAKGYFFKFADHFFYMNKDKNYSGFSDEFLIKEFEKFLNTQKFEYNSETEQQIDKLISDISKNNYDTKLADDLKKIRNQFEELGNHEMVIYKDEILKELRGELASRYMGMEARVKEMLNYDQQFQTALKLISNNNLYEKLLKNN